MSMRSYTGFQRSYTKLLNRLFWTCFLFIVGSVSITVLLDRYSPQFRQANYDQPIIIATVFGGIAMLIAMFIWIHIRLYRVDCPQCTARLDVRARRPECRDTYSGLCSVCGTLWDLEVKNTED